MPSEITALVKVLSSHRRKTEAPEGRRLSRFEMHGDGRVEITRVLKGEAPAPKAKPLAISFERCKNAPSKCKRGETLQVDGFIEYLTKSEDILYAIRVCVPTEAGERALSYQRDFSAQEKRNDLIDKGKGFMLSDSPSSAIDPSRQDICALQHFLESHGLPFDLETCIFIDSYFKRRLLHRGGAESVADMVIENPLVLADIYATCREPLFSEANLVKSFNLRPSEESRVYAKAVSFLNICAMRGDTFVPITKLFGALKDDLRCKPKDWLFDLLMGRKSSDSFFRFSARLSCFSAMKNFGCMEGTLLRYYRGKLEAELPADKEKADKCASATVRRTSIYLIKNFFGERRAAEKFAARLGAEETPVTGYSVDEKFTEEQEEAVRDAFGYRTSVITGSAGCGKTAVVAEIVRIAEENGKSSIVLAPSAKAALHAAKEASSSVPYQTIHRFAKIVPEDSDAGEDGDFLPVSENPTRFDFVIIDEMSMCELSVFNRVLRALESSPSAHLVLVGDPMQLPAIGPQFFHHLADGLLGDALPVARLTKNFRSASDALAAFGDDVRAGRFLVPESGHVMFEESALDKFIRMHEVLLADPDTMFLAARKEDVAELNVAIRAVRNPDAEPVGTSQFFLGDRVIATINDYADGKGGDRSWRHEKRDVDVFNGTDGVIESYDEESDTVLVRLYSPEYDGGEALVPYKMKELGVHLAPAFALTVHKAQGSQFDRVVFFLPRQAGGVSRNLVYTAVTRARNELCLVGDGEKFLEAVGKMAHCGNSFFSFRVLNELEENRKRDENSGLRRL